MMEYFRNYLIFVRKKENTSKGKIKFSTSLIITAVIGLILGVVLDYFLDFSQILNSIRGIVSVITGASIFTASYIKAVEKEQLKASGDRFYLRIRERFSHKQRVNISILFGAISFGIILLSEFDFLYTFKSSLFIFFILTLITFSRQRRSEFIKKINNLPDIRDIKNKKTK